MPRKPTPLKPIPRPVLAERGATGAPPSPSTWRVASCCCSRRPPMPAMRPLAAAPRRAGAGTAPAPTPARAHPVAMATRRRRRSPPRRSCRSSRGGAGPTGRFRRGPARGPTRRRTSAPSRAGTRRARRTCRRYSRTPPSSTTTSTGSFFAHNSRFLLGPGWGRQPPFFKRAQAGGRCYSCSCPGLLRAAGAGGGGLPAAGRNTGTERTGCGC